MGWKLGRARGPALRELHGDEARRVFREGPQPALRGPHPGPEPHGPPAAMARVASPRPPASSASRRTRASSGIMSARISPSSLPSLPRLAGIPSWSRLQPVAVTRPAAAARAVTRAPFALPGPGPALGGGDGCAKGLRIHALLREVLVRDAIDPAARPRLPGRPSPVVQTGRRPAVLVEAVLRELAKRGWERLPRRTEFELTGAGRTGGGGRADLVLWAPDRRNPSPSIWWTSSSPPPFCPRPLNSTGFSSAGYRDGLAGAAPRDGHRSLGGGAGGGRLGEADRRRGLSPG